jgi:molybdopterin synthase catalytic subunit
VETLKLTVHVIDWAIEEKDWRPVVAITDGCLLTFSGMVRESEGGQIIRGLVYEAYRGMAEKELVRVANEAHRHRPIREVVVVHRLGEIRVNETAIYLAVLSAHRGEAIRFMEFFLDRLKEEVPIWKTGVF